MPAAQQSDWEERPALFGKRAKSTGGRVSSFFQPEGKGRSSSHTLADFAIHGGEEERLLDLAAQVCYWVCWGQLLDLGPWAGGSSHPAEVVMLRPNREEGTMCRLYVHRFPLIYFISPPPALPLHAAAGAASGGEGGAAEGAGGTVWILVPPVAVGALVLSNASGCMGQGTGR